MKRNASVVYLMAILGLLLVATMFCGCTSSEKATPATAKATSAPTLAPEKTMAATSIPTVEQTQMVPVAENATKVNATETNKTPASVSEPQKTETTSAGAKSENMTAEKPVKNETAKVTNTTGATTAQVKETGANQTENSVESKNATSTKAPTTAANKTAAL